jgi:zinc protease
VTRDIKLDIGEQVLDSGLTLLAVRNPGVSTFACVASLDIRAGDEPEDQPGLANLVGECLDEGTALHHALALAAAVEAIGGALEGNQRGGSVQCPAEHQKDGMKLLREILVEPEFPGREVRRVVGEIQTEIIADDEDPRVVARRRFMKEVYGKHPLSRPGTGTIKSVGKLRPKDLRRWHDRFFVPAGGYIAAAGPDEPRRMLEQLARAFGSFRGKAPAHADIPGVSMPVEPRDVHLPMAREQVHVFLGHPGIRRMHPDFYVLMVMDHILGTGPGFTSRCSRRLRDEMGLCYSVTAGITPSAGEEPGTFAAYMGTSPEHRQAAIDGFLDEIRRIRTTLPGEQELQDVKDYLTGSFVLGLERNSNLAAYAVRARRFELGFDYLHRYPDLIRSITGEAVRAAAEQHLQPEAMIAVSAGAS